MPTHTPHRPAAPAAPNRSQRAASQPPRLRTAAQVHADIDRLAAAWGIPAAASYILDSREAIEAIKTKIYRVEADRAVDLAFATKTLRAYESKATGGASAGNPLGLLLARELKRQTAARERAAAAKAKARRESVDMLHKQILRLDLELKHNGLGGLLVPPGA
jgi:hypothetical protein